MALTVFGYDPESVLAVEKNGSRACILRYGDYDVTLNYTRGTSASTGVIIGKNSNVAREIDISLIYRQEVEAFIETLRTGKMHHSREQLIKPVKVITAMEESVRQGREIAIL